MNNGRKHKCETKVRNTPSQQKRQSKVPNQIVHQMPQQKSAHKQGQTQVIIKSPTHQVLNQSPKLKS